MAGGEIVSVGMGEAFAAKDPTTVLVAYGLGSCVGICLYDPIAKVGGMAHVMLPDSREGKISGASAKFADQAVPLLIKEVLALGASKARLIVKIAGGAQMIVAPGFVDRFNIGERNVTAVSKMLEAHSLKLSSADTGGNMGRTVQLFVHTGQVLVRTAGKDSREL